MSERIARLDRVQRRHKKLGIGVATVKKFTEDDSPALASMIAFWAFFSIFPLFLFLVTLLGYVLPSGRRTDVLEHVSSFFPLIDASSIRGLSGSWWPLLIGAVSALWSGSAVVRVTQLAFNSVWELQRKDRSGVVKQLSRSLLALGTIGVGLVAATIVSGLMTGSDAAVDIGLFGRVLGFLIALGLDVGLFLVAFRMLTDRDVSFRDVLPGALLAGLSFWILQQASSLIVTRYLNKAESTYGNFATVITILWWFYLQAQITLIGAQLNVVLKERLHPRSLVGGPETEADRRALEAYAEQATYHETEEVDARFDGDRREDAERSSAGRRR